MVNKIGNKISKIFCGISSYANSFLAKHKTNFEGLFLTFSFYCNPVLLPKLKFFLHKSVYYQSEHESTVRSQPKSQQKCNAVQSQIRNERKIMNLLMQSWKMLCNYVTIINYISFNKKHKHLCTHLYLNI